HVTTTASATTFYTILAFVLVLSLLFCFFFTHTPTTEIYTLSLHDALPISAPSGAAFARCTTSRGSGSIPPVPATLSRSWGWTVRSEEHTSELQSQSNLVCRLLLEKKK